MFVIKRNGTKEGFCIAVEMINQVKKYAQEISAFNRFDYAAEIIEACKE